MGETRPFVLAATWLLAAASVSCGGAETCAGTACGQATTLRARGTFTPKAGSSLAGQIELIEKAGVVTLLADVTGAPPGKLGFHIHEKGDCSAPDFSSAGGHFNPTSAPHACPPTVPRHAGDFGNMDIDPSGRGHLEAGTDLVTLSSGPRSVTGLAVILHEGTDDCVTQPVGHAGGRLACAVIRLE